MIQDNRTVFLYWHTREEAIPVIHRMNIDNIRRRLEKSGWSVVVTSIDPQSPFYIEKFIGLPAYFYDLPNRITDHSGLHGNESDIIRLRLLERYGGCYFDTSTILLRDRIENIRLYIALQQATDATLAGYTNYTFTRKNFDGTNYFPHAVDGMELGVLFAKQHSPFLRMFNKEIDQYWQWKRKGLRYKDYPLFAQNKLAPVSFLNEYHVHYSIFQLLLSRDRSLLNHLVTQSMHMIGKENSCIDGPYSIQDRFCRGKTTYDAASPERLLLALLPGNLSSWDGTTTTLAERIKMFFTADLLVFPGYIRTVIEQYFRTPADYEIIESAYRAFYAEKMPLVDEIDHRIIWNRI